MKPANRSGKAIPWIIVLLIAIVMGVTNPSENDHREKIKSALRSGLAQEGMAGTLFTLMGGTDVVLENLPLQYNNYILVSTMSVNGETASTGYLGNISLK